MNLSTISKVINKETNNNHVVKVLLKACSQVYGVGTRAHRFLYKNNILTSKSLDVPTISVGNITVGGTGKTPIVQHLAQLILNQGGTPLILSRGYGQDEQYQLDARLRSKGVKLAFGADRYKAAQNILNQIDTTTKTPPNGSTTAILDDGLQHWALQRDLDIVVLNAYDPWGGNKILPAGRLREYPKNGLERADLVIIHNVSKRISTKELTDIHVELSHLIAPTIPIVETGVVPATLYMENEQGKLVEKDKNEIKNKNVIAISGIGCSNGFIDMLSDQLQVDAIDAMSYPDHHIYTTSDVELLLKRMNELNYIPITTEKDYYRCKQNATSSSSSLFLKKLKPYIITTDIQVLQKEQDAVQDPDPEVVLNHALQLAVQRYQQRQTQ